MEKLTIDLFVDENSTIEEKMIKEFNDCPSAVKYCKSLGIPNRVIEDNIVKLIDFVMDLNYCKNCPGAANCKKENACFISTPTYQNGVLDKKIVPCKELLKKVSFERQFSVRDFDEKWLQSSLKSLDQTKERGQVLAKYLDYIKNNNPGWIYINGGLNSGRSYLAAMIAVDIAKRDKGPICFLNSARRIGELKELNNAFNSAEFQKRIDLYSTCPVLVLDDFGNEYKNDMIRDAIVFRIISNRSANRLFTIITSDFTINEIETLYTTNKAGEIRAKQIGRIIRNAAKEEINLGDLSIY